MSEERTYNVLQFDKFSSSKAFVEINEAFGIDKIRLGFRQYDKTKAAGDRMNVSIDYYLSPRAAQEMADAILEKRYCVKTQSGTMMLSQVQNSRQNWINQGSPDKGFFYQTAPGGTEVDGRTIYRIVKILPSNTADYRFAAYQAPGKRDEQGLIQRDGDYSGYVFVPVSEADLAAFGHALENAVHAYNQYKFRKWTMAGGGQPAANK